MLEGGPDGHYEKDATTIIGIHPNKQRALEEGQDRLLGRHDRAGKPYGARSSIKKRSVVIGGRKTSVSLENEFWDEVKNVAKFRGLSVEAFVSEVVAAHEVHNVSSALRLTVLEHYRGKGLEHRDGRSMR